MSPKKKHEEEEIQIDEVLAPQILGYGGTDEDAGDTPGMLAKIQKLKADLAACKAEKQEYLDGWQRLKADVVNARKAEEERNKRGKAVAQENFIADLIPIFDSFDMARAGSGWEKVDPAWKQGIDHIFGQLEGVITNAGASRFGAVGETFDPLIHEAVKEVPPERTDQENKIVAILRSGWKIGEFIVRPAQVTVAHTGLSSNQ